MKNQSPLKLISIILVAVLCLLALPALAQDVTSEAEIAATVESGSVVIVDGEGETTVVEETNEGTVIVTPPTSRDPLPYLIVFALAAFFIADKVWGGKVTDALKTLVPAETAAGIYQSGVRAGLELGLNQASQTPTPYDEQFFEWLSTQGGYTVNKRPDGKYEVQLPSTGFGVPPSVGGKPV
jgi:hypothetical protein